LENHHRECAWCTKEDTEASFHMFSVILP
jgi:hypothetical protein